MSGYLPKNEIDFSNLPWFLRAKRRLFFALVAALLIPIVPAFYFVTSASGASIPIDAFHFICYSLILSCFAVMLAIGIFGLGLLGQYQDTWARQNQILNSIADPIFVKDRQHRWVLLNGAYCRFMGHSLKELLGRSDHDFFPKKEADVFWEKDEIVFRTGQENLNEEAFTDAEGVAHTVLTKKALYMDKNGRPFIVGIIRDMTDKKIADEALMKKTAELARSNAEREQLELFAYVASHDLREPLQSIIGFGDLLKTRCLDALHEDGKNYLKRILDAAQRMSRLIDDLLKFSRAIKRSELFRSVDLMEVVKGVLEDLEFQIRLAGASIQYDTLPVVYGDPSQVRQLFQNLISNALKFRSAEQPPQIFIRSRALDEGLQEICVEDNGIGFDEKYLDRIFKPFERLHGRTEYEGSGMGLAICEKIVNHHQGKIFAESAPGKGSKFFVVLHHFVEEKANQ